MAQELRGRTSSKHLRVLLLRATHACAPPTARPSCAGFRGRTGGSWRWLSGTAPASAWSSFPAPAVAGRSSTRQGRALVALKAALARTSAVHPCSWICIHSLPSAIRMGASMPRIAGNRKPAAPAAALQEPPLGCAWEVSISGAVCWYCWALLALLVITPRRQPALLLLGAARPNLLPMPLYTDPGCFLGLCS